MARRSRRENDRGGRTRIGAMKNSHWRMWAAFALLALVLGVRALSRISSVEHLGGSAFGQGLIAAGWFVFLVHDLERSGRGYRNEQRRQHIGDRIRSGRDPAGNSVLSVLVDVPGQRTDMILLFVAFGMFAWGNALGRTASSQVVAWTTGAISWAMLVSFGRTFKFSTHLLMTQQGIDCRFALPALVVPWDEIESIRSTGTPGKTGWVLVTLTETALGRSDEKVRKRMQRVFKSKGAHYRWADHYSYSSAGEVATIAEHYRASPEARADMTSELLVSSAVAGPIIQASVISANRSPVDPGKTPLADRRRAGLLAAGGAAVRVIAYFLPWVIASGARTIYINGSKVGAPLFSIWFSLAALGVAIAYLSRRQETTPGLLVGLGIGAVFASLINFMVLMESIDQARGLLAARGAGIDLAPSVGPWVQMAGALGILVGGIWATRLSRRDDEVSTSAAATTMEAFAGAPPPRPDRLPGAPLPLAPTAKEPSSSKSTLKIVAISASAILFVFAVIPTFLGARTRAQEKEAARHATPTVQTPGPSSAPTSASTSPPPPLVLGGHDATAFQVDAAHDGNARNSGIQLPLSHSWTRSWNGAVSYPLIADDRVFVTVIPNSGPAQHPKRVFALDASTGKTLWSHDEAGNFILGIAFDRGRLFVLDDAGLLQAYEARSGALDWSATIPLSMDFGRTPTAWGGRLYVGEGAVLAAIDETSGAVLWTHDVVDGAKTSPTLFGGSVAVGYPCVMHALSVNEGTMEWEHSTGCGGGAQTAAYYDGRIYARGDLGGTILDAGDGKEIGTFTSSTIPAFGGTTGYFLEDGTLRARDLSTMNVLWSFAGDDSLGSQPIVVGNSVFIGSGNGTLYQLDERGRVEGSFRLGAPASPPDEHNLRMLTGMNAGDGILAVSASGKLVVFR